MTTVMRTSRSGNWMTRACRVSRLRRAVQAAANPFFEPPATSQPNPYKKEMQGRRFSRIRNPIGRGVSLPPWAAKRRTHGLRGIYVYLSQISLVMDSST